MKSFKQALRENEYDPFSMVEHEIRHGGWIGEHYGARLLAEKLSGPGERSERVPKEQMERYHSVMNPQLQHLHDTYGPADSKPASTKELAKRVSGRFDELTALRKNSPKKYNAEVSAAKARRKAPGKTNSEGKPIASIGHPVANNSKTESVAEVPGKNAPNGHIPVSMAFTPDTARHYTHPEGKTYIERNVCSGSSSGCRSACLAKHGNYGFTTNKAYMDGRTQALTHNEASTRDHATLAYHAMHKATKDAEAGGKKVIVRTAISDDVGPEIHDQAIKKHFPKAALMRYTKKVPSGDHDLNGDGDQKTWSDSGPMVKRTTGKDGTVTKSLARENIQRRGLDRKVETHPRYMVFNQARGDEEKGANIDHLKRVRKYEPLPSKPEAGEKAEHHHPDGYGRVEHNGQSYRYQDHPIVKSVTSVSGKKMRPYEHDVRTQDTDQPIEKLKTRSGKHAGPVIPSLSTKGTPKREFESSGFFHHIENIDKSGVYHDGHPKEMAEAGFKGATKTPPK